MLAKSKLNSIETLISQALIDMEISHEEFIIILTEKDKYEKMNMCLKTIAAKQRIKLWEWVAWNQKLKTNVTYKDKMKTYCMKCKKDTEKIYTKMFRTKKKKINYATKSPFWGIKNSGFIKNQEAKVY